MVTDGEASFESEHCTLTIRHPAPRVVVVSFIGNDVGQFGEAPFKVLASHIEGDGALELFIDARGGVAASLDVSGDWARWLAANKRHLRHVSMLTGSRFIQLSATFVRKFADMGELMRLYTDPAAFEGALANSIANAAS
jgi:hypothetical protein